MIALIITLVLFSIVSAGLLIGFACYNWGDALQDDPGWFVHLPPEKGFKPAALVTDPGRVRLAGFASGLPEPRGRQVVLACALVASAMFLLLFGAQAVRLMLDLDGDISEPGDQSRTQEPLDQAETWIEAQQRNVNTTAH